MEWWSDLGAYAAFFGDIPALAVDMTTKAPNIDMGGAHAAYAVQSTQAPMPVYEGGAG